MWGGLCKAPSRVAGRGSTGERGICEAYCCTDPGWAGCWLQCWVSGSIPVVAWFWIRRCVWCQDSNILNGVHELSGSEATFLSQRLLPIVFRRPILSLPPYPPTLLHEPTTIRDTTKEN